MKVYDPVLCMVVDKPEVKKKTRDGMFQKVFGEYSKGAKVKLDRFIKDLSAIKSKKEFDSKYSGYEKELRNSLDRLDEAYNVAGQDYYAARREIQQIMEDLNKQSFKIYQQLSE